MSYQLSNEDILASLKADGIHIPEEQEEKKSSFFDKAANYADKFNKFVESSGLPNLGAGVLSAGPKLGVNVLNTPGAISNKLLGTNIPKAHLPDWLNPSSSKNLGHSPIQNAMGMGGELLGDIITGGGLYKGASKLAKLNESSSLLKRGLVGAGTGYASGDEDQFGGRGLTSVLGGALPIVSGLSKSTIGKRAAELNSKMESKYKKIYDSIISQGEKLGTNKLNVPTILKNKTEDIQKLYKAAPSKYKASVQRFENNPTLQNAHDAQSDLGKIKRHLQDKIDKGQVLSSTESAALHEAETLQKRVRGSIQQHFAKNGRNDLATHYGNTTTGYAKEVVPFKTKEMAKLKAGKGSTKAVAKDLIGSKSFAESEMASKIPGYGVRRAIHETPMWAKGLAGGAVIPTLSASGVPIPYYIRKILGG